MSAVPSWEVVSAIESGESEITRRIEIYEQDGLTRWLPSEDEVLIKRIVNGSVSVDATRSERRSLDLTLLNDDGLLRPNPKGGFWYDKVIKCFRGVHYSRVQRPPAIEIVEDQGSNTGMKFAARLKGLGYTRTNVDLVSTSYDAFRDIDILVSYTGPKATIKSDFLAHEYKVGKSIFTISCANTSAQVPTLGAGGPQPDGTTWGVTPVVTDTPVSGLWTTGVAPTTAAGWGPSAPAAGALAVASWTNGSSSAMVTASLMSNDAGGQWFDLHLPSVEEAHVMQLITAALRWLQNYTPYGDYETQIGEFLIDNFNDQSFPFQIKLSGRDYTKRMLNSKLTQDVIFVEGTSVTDLIRAVARNSGITNEIFVPEIGSYLTSDLAYGRNTDRWQIAANAALGCGYQLFFSPTGNLTLLPLPDPTFDPVNQVFKTGPDGNLVDYSRQVNDSNLYNHIVVYGSASSDAIPFFGEAINTDGNSPTSVAEIGDRYYEYDLDTVGSDAEAASLANKFLKVSGLETYEMSFNSIVYPWTEVNTVNQVLDPEAESYEPDKYLTDSATIPLTLGPMGMNGKRITLVGEPN